MQTKLFEIRDRATFIPAIGTLMVGGSRHEAYLCRRSGYGEDFPLVLLGQLRGGPATYNPDEWGGSRTMSAAHEYIASHWDAIDSGDVIDVEFILGETTTKKNSERLDG